MSMQSCFDQMACSALLQAGLAGPGGATGGFVPGRKKYDSHA
jgi:hypothetical protein